MGGFLIYFYVHMNYIYREWYMEKRGISYEVMVESVTLPSSIKCIPIKHLFSIKRIEREPYTFIHSTRHGTNVRESNFNSQFIVDKSFFHFCRFCLVDLWLIFSSSSSSSTALCKRFHYMISISWLGYWLTSRLNESYRAVLLLLEAFFRSLNEDFRFTSYVLTYFCNNYMKSRVKVLLMYEKAHILQIRFGG